MNNILFICLGNICRSPLVEGFLRHEIELKQLGEHFNIDSAGTGNWHAGKAPDHRAVRAAAELGVDVSGSRARQIKTEDFSRFDRLIAMDRDNLSDLQCLRQNLNSNIRLDLLSDLLEEPGFVDVPDPWYGSYSDFQAVARQLHTASTGLLERLRFDG